MLSKFLRAHPILIPTPAKHTVYVRHTNNPGQLAHLFSSALLHQVRAFRIRSSKSFCDTSSFSPSIILILSLPRDKQDYISLAAGCHQQTLPLPSYITNKYATQTRDSITTGTYSWRITEAEMFPQGTLPWRSASDHRFDDSHKQLCLQLSHSSFPHATQETPEYLLLTKYVKYQRKWRTVPRGKIDLAYFTSVSYIITLLTNNTGSLQTAVPKQQEWTLRTHKFSASC